MTQRIALYLRISADPEDTRLGVARQEKDCLALAERHGWDATETYTDNDTSAYSGKTRSQWERLMGDVRSGTVTRVIAWHTDRLTRRPIDLEDLLERSERGTCYVHTAVDGMDTTTISGRTTLRILAAIARQESEHKAARIKAKHLELAHSGASIGGGNRAFGYRRIYDRDERPRKIVREEIVPEEATVIRECAHRVLAGEALAAVTRDLNRRGVQTSTGRQWTTGTLARTLASAKISGRREHRPRSRGDTKRVRIGEIAGTGAWPAIITVAESDRLRAILTDDSRRTSPGATGRHLLSGLVYCSRCEQRMVGRSRGGGKRVYMCDGQPGRPGCGRMYIDADGTEAHVAELVAVALSSAEYRQSLMRHGQDTGEGDLVEAIQTEEHELEQLAADLGQRRISRKEWMAAREPIEARLAQWRQALSRVDTARALDGLPETYEGLRRFLLYGDMWRRKAVLAQVLLWITIHPPVRGRARFDSDRIDPHWRV